VLNPTEFILKDEDRNEITTSSIRRGFLLSIRVLNSRKTTKSKVNEKRLIITRRKENEKIIYV
jgi:hypothetical protein